MKNLYLWACLLGCIVFMHSCLSDECTSTNTYVQLNPVMMTAAQFRTNTIKTSTNVALENPGKIYFYNNYLFLNDKGKGVHVYNIQNLSKPIHEIFYEIPGNFDIAIKDDHLIVDNVIDLISIDIKDVRNPVLKTRHQNYKFGQESPGQSFVAYYERTNISRIIDCSQTGPNENFANWGGGWWLNSSRFAVDAQVFSTNEVSGSNGNGGGVAGSTSKFMIAKNMLYTLNDNQLWAWNPANLDPVKKVDIGWGIETLFAYNDLLFVGSNSGVFIYDLQDPLSPVQLSSLTHTTACDPVVVQGTTAYVTLRSGNACTGTDNQLDIIDIANPRSPKLVKTYAMKNPHGLAIRGERLYICEGEYGFKILDAEDRDKIKEKSLDKNIKSTDVIALNEQYVMVVGSKGFYILDVLDANNIKTVSSITTDN